MSYGALGSTGFGAAGGPAWYQVWGARGWIGWLWADAAAALRLAKLSDATIRTASGQRVGRPAYCKGPGAFRTDAHGIESLKPECR